MKPRRWTIRALSKKMWLGADCRFPALAYTATRAGWNRNGRVRMLRFPSSPNVAADLVALFRDGLQRSRVTKGEAVVVYADTFTLPAYPGAFLAAARDCGAEAIQIIQP